jgi:hypothetical protein
MCAFFAHKPCHLKANAFVGTSDDRYGTIIPPASYMNYFRAAFMAAQELFGSWPLAATAAGSAGNRMHVLMRSAHCKSELMQLLCSECNALKLYISNGQVHAAVCGYCAKPAALPDVCKCKIACMC